MIKIDIPATSANLGAGFDTLGLALNLYNTVYMEEWDGVFIEQLDNVPIPTDEHNLIYSTAKSLYEYCGREFRGLHIKQENNIPLARGLGSSSACIAAGLLGANELLGSPLSRQEIINLAAKDEGHPDNSTPAILGGLVTSAIEDGEVHYCKADLSDDITFMVIIPDFEIRTADARKVIPGEISLKDGVFNVSRASLMFASLAGGKYENLKTASQDKFHQPFRLPLIKYSHEILNKCMELGAYCGQLSGSGSTLISIVPADNKGFYDELRGYLDSLGLDGWKLKALKADNCGAKISTI